MAQEFRGSEMLSRLPPSERIHSISREFIAVWLAITAAPGLACSSGETGLVLGRPLIEQGGAGGQAGTASIPEGGDSGASAGSAGSGDAGAGGALDPPWLVDQCSPTVTFENSDTTSKGQLFTDAVPSPGQLVRTAARNTCRALYRTASEVRAITNITLLVEEYDGIAYTSGTSMHLSTNYLQSSYDRGVDLPLEIAGVLHFTTSLVYQNNSNGTAPGWLVTGIADFVRLRAGLIDLAGRTRGGSYDRSSQTTAFFLDYLATRNPDIVPQLNRRLLPSAGAWTDDAFVTLMGSDLDTLWSDYQASLP